LREAALLIENTLQNPKDLLQAVHDARDAIMLTPGAIDKPMIALLDAGQLPWLTSSQIDALIEDSPWRLQAKNSDEQLRQWLADANDDNDDDIELDSHDRRKVGARLARWTEFAGPRAAEFLRPYFRNPIPQWYVPIACTLQRRMQQVKQLRQLLRGFQEQARATQFQVDPTAPSADGNVRLLALLLELLDRRALLGPFLSQAAELDVQGNELGMLADRFNLWLTALVGFATIETPEPPKARSVRRGAPAKRAGAVRKTARKKKYR
jgi:hypothetical protein